MTQISNLLYYRYRLIALVVYAAVLCAGVVDWAYGGIGPVSIVYAPPNFRFLLFVIAVLALISLELKGVGKASFTASQKLRPLPFIIRLVLFVGACLVTDLNYSPILFLPILLYSYLAVSKRLSYFIAFLGVAALFGFSITHSGFTEPPTISPPVFINPQSPATSPKGPNLVGILIDRSMGALITLLFTLLLARAISQATQAQQKLTGLFAKLEASHLQLKQYSNRVAHLAATEERNRLARDIHDSLGHHLAAINIQLEKANAYRQRDPDRACEAIHHAQHTVQDALKDVRESVSSLRQEGDPFCFADSLNGLIARMHHSKLHITLEQTGDDSNYSRLKLMTLYRVVQEGLTNVHKHAQASEVAIALHFTPQTAHLHLTDNGVGFNIATWKQSSQKQATQGLVGLQERVSLVGGTLCVQSSPAGTTLTSTLPQSQPTATTTAITRAPFTEELS
ncbi:MAG: sensor histidine kinase [Cyanobacteria bacterium P01_C01_bin.69]